MMLGWELERKLEQDGIELYLKGYVVKRWADKIEIYRKGLPCCLFATAKYQYHEMEALMRGLRLHKYPEGE